MDGLNLLLAILTVWRITHLFQAEDGPWDIVVRLRKAAGHSFWGSLMDCFYCLSLWIALPFGLWFGVTWVEKFLWWMSCSAGAILLEKATEKKTINSDHP